MLGRPVKSSWWDWRPQTAVLGLWGKGHDDTASRDDGILWNYMEVVMYLVLGLEPMAPC